MTIKLWKPEMHADTGKPIVGLAIHKVMLEGDIAEVAFSLKRKGDSRVFPNTFYITKQKALTFPQEVIKGVRLVKIPLHEFKEATPKAEPPIIIKAEPRNLGNIPTRPCWVCMGTKFWRTSWGECICVICHPNPNPEVNTEEVDIVGKVEIK